MRPFEYRQAANLEDALAIAGEPGPAESLPQYLAGGTNVLDLMKIDVMHPSTLVDINGLQAQHSAIVADASGLRLGALARMSDVADHPDVRRDYPAISDALWQAASPQLRNMASLAGNVLQRTRCNYFRDVSWPCNKRNPGSGCSAMAGVNRRLAVLGVSEHCIANYAGDFAHVLAALGAEVELMNVRGERRTMPFEALHRFPGATPHIETNLAQGDFLTSFHVPAGAWTRRSLYRKVRDRESYEFALASAAVALHLVDGVVQASRIGIGGTTTRPWRSREAEEALKGARLDESAARKAADAAYASAVTHGENSFKPELGRRTLVRALVEAASMRI